MACGLTITHSLDDLSLFYLATVQAIAYGTKHIIDEMNSHGHKINTIFMCGGLSKNELYVQQHADITRCKIFLPREDEVMIVGSACLGSVAGGKYKSVMEAMNAMNAIGKVISPVSDDSLNRYHSLKFKIFREMFKDQLKYKKIMSEYT